MARPKTDSENRKNEFLNAARILFFTKGYANTSIKNILDEVGKRSVSPSVFYYYFKSKEDIYQQIMENYIEDYIHSLELLFSDESINIEDRFIGSIDIFIKTLDDSAIAINKNKSLENEFFILDLQERIKKRMIEIWNIGLNKLDWLDYGNKEYLSFFIVGGICELVYDYVFNENTSFNDSNALTKHIVKFTLDILKAPQNIIDKFNIKLKIQDKG
ncbi:MAG: TetR/AcrR family transcriptional regulator [Tissierellia bacterium]|nr:TetR/AcrR family transcriptional regulator [Tissierellia bacterium]